MRLRSIPSIIIFSVWMDSITLYERQVLNVAEEFFIKKCIVQPFDKKQLRLYASSDENAIIDFREAIGRPKMTI